MPLAPRPTPPSPALLRAPLFPRFSRLRVALLGGGSRHLRGYPQSAQHRVDPLVAILDPPRFFDPPPRFLVGAKLPLSGTLDQPLLLVLGQPALAAQGAVPGHPRKPLLEPSLPIPSKPAGERAPPPPRDPGGVGYALSPPHRPQSHKPLARLQVPLLLVEFVKLIRAFLPVYGLHYYATHHVLRLLPYAYPAPLILMGHYHTDLVLQVDLPLCGGGSHQWGKFLCLLAWSVDGGCLETFLEHLGEAHAEHH